MNKHKLINVLVGIVIVVSSIYIVAGQITVAQLPPSFTITLEPLPPPQSSNQLLFRCPYTTNVIIHSVKVWNQGMTTANATVTLRSPDCQQSLGYIDFSINGLSSQQTVTSLSTSINQYIQQEAQSNHQPTIEMQPIAVGSSP